LEELLHWAFQSFGKFQPKEVGDLFVEQQGFSQKSHCPLVNQDRLEGQLEKNPRLKQELSSRLTLLN